MHMNSFAPISMTGIPGSLWKCGTMCSAMVKALGTDPRPWTYASASLPRKRKSQSVALVQDARRLAHQRQRDLFDQVAAQPFGIRDARRDLLRGGAVRSVEHDA